MGKGTVTRDFPITMEQDVVVCGGGTAGSVAAIAAARNGARTVILESSGGLGGTATNGGVTGFHGFRRHWESKGAEQVIWGMAQEIHDRLVEIGGAIGKKGEVPAAAVSSFDPELYKLLMERMCQEAGVGILYQTYVVDAIVEGNTVQGVTLVNKSGKAAIRGKVIIDCTGDADVAASAGADFIRGRIGGRPMPFTLCFIMGNVDCQKARDFVRKEGITSILRRAQQRGDLSFAKGADDFGYFGILPVLREGSFRNDETWINCDMVYNTDATNAEQLTHAWLYGRQRVYEVANFLRKYVSGLENGHVLYTYPMMGIRDSRNIVGDYVLTEEDFLEAKRHPDVIGRSGRAMNVHPPSGLPKNSTTHFGTPPFWTETRVPYDIPYRILLPKGLENILVAGRCISAKGLIQGSMRGEPQCMVTGQAAGTAAAIAVRDGVTAREVDVAKVQSKLREQGAVLGT